MYIFKMPREKGKEWDHVTIIELKDKSATATWAWLSAPSPWCRGLRHKHGKSSATMRSARAVMQTTVGAMRTAAAMRRR